MLSWLRAKSRTGRTATELYGSIVTQARRREFYIDHGVTDTPEGRFSLIVAHLFVALERLRVEGEAGQELARAVVETFVADMDASLREMGIGDFGVPKRVKKAAAALYDCVAEYRAAMAAEETDALATALGRHVPCAPEGCKAIARYLRASTAALAAAPADGLLAGRIAFPLPPRIAEG